MHHQPYLREILIAASILALSALAAEDDKQSTSVVALKDTLEPCDPALGGEDCSSYPFEVCSTGGVCEHKDVFPAEAMEIFGYVIMPFLFSLASVGGIGGGIIFVPLTIGVFNFRTKEAIAIASAIVLISACLRFVLMSAYAPHPERQNATQIDYNLIKVVFPIFLTGSYFGVLLSVSLGELILAVCMMTLLALLSF